MLQHHDLEQRAHVERVAGGKGGEASVLNEEAPVSQCDQEGRLEGGPCGGVDGGQQESTCGERRKGALARLLGSANDRGCSRIRGSVRRRREVEGGVVER